MEQAVETTRDTPVVHVVDDDVPTRTAIARLLRVAGHAVETYATAPEFLAVAPAEQPGCVVLDVRLPGQTGLQLQEMLSNVKDTLPIIFVTGYGDIAMSVQAIRSGAVDFLTKPVCGHEPWTLYREHWHSMRRIARRAKGCAPPEPDSIA